MFGRASGIYVWFVSHPRIWVGQAGSRMEGGKRQDGADSGWTFGMIASLDQLYAFHYRLDQPHPSTKTAITTNTSADPPTTTSQHVSGSSTPRSLTTTSPSGVSAPGAASDNGWNVYSPREEFGRMGVGSRSKAWRFTDINKDYVVSPSSSADSSYHSPLSSYVQVEKLQWLI